MVEKDVRPPKGLTLLSDLHTECGLERPLRTIRKLVKDDPSSKVLALAGDLGNWTPTNLEESSFCQLLRQTSELGSFKHILVVPGNHDYYTCQVTEPLASHEDPTTFFDEADDCLREIVSSFGCTFLQKDVVVVGKAVVAGTTLWSPALDASVESRSYMNDYVAIDGFTPSICHALHEDQKVWLHSMVTDPEIGVDIVLTHHPPLDHPKLHHRAYTTESAPLFHADLSSTFDHFSFSPRFWGFGHTHVRKAVYLDVGKVSATKPNTCLFMANALGDPYSDRLWDLPSHHVRLV